MLSVCKGCKNITKLLFVYFIVLQSNLSTTATLGTPKKWPLYRGGRSVEGFQSKLVSKLAWPDFVRPLLTGGRCSEVAVYTGLTVLLRLDNRGQNEYEELLPVELFFKNIKYFKFYYFFDNRFRNY